MRLCSSDKHLVEAAIHLADILLHQANVTSTPRVTEVETRVRRVSTFRSESSDVETQANLEDSIPASYISSYKDIDQSCDEAQFDPISSGMGTMLDSSRDVQEDEILLTMGSDIAFSTGNILANGLNNDSMKSKSLERVPTGSAREQAKVYPPARSTPSSRRIGVRLLQATDLVAREEFDPFAEVRVENTVTKSQAISKNAHPEWNDFLVFNVKNPEVAVLKVKLLDGMRCFKNVLLGEVQLAIKGFAMDPEGSRIPKWHVLTKKGKVAGKLMMQVYYVGEQENRPLRVACKTWNVGNEEPADSFRSCFRNLDGDGYDLVAVGVQECYYKVGPQNDDSSSGPTLFPDTYPGSTRSNESSPGTPTMRLNRSGSFGVDSTGRRSGVRISNAAQSLKKAFDKLPQQAQDTKIAFEDLLRDALGDEYCMVKSIHMRHIRMFIFASNAIFPAISNIKFASQATGVGGVGQNKGGVAIALNVWDTELCFINSHLAAHQDKTPARNAMYRNIIRGLRLDPYNMDIVTGYHHIFWMGDLNYRIMFGQQGASPTDEDFGALIQLCYEKNINGLLELDQLRQQIAKKKAFDDFQEGQITFVPTYKMERKAGQIWDPMRLPAWCDRVLWKSLIPSKNVEVLDYYSVPEITSSDHKPVVGFYLVPTVTYTYDGGKDKMVVVDIISLFATGLFMLKKRARNNLSPPNPQVIINCPRLKQQKTSIVLHTRDPVWRSPIRLKFKETELHDLVNYRLMFRVVSVSQGNPQTIGRGVLNFDQVLSRTKCNKRVSFTFNVALQYNGLGAGNLCGDVKASVKSKRRARKNFSEPLLEQLARDGMTRPGPMRE